MQGWMATTIILASLSGCSFIKVNRLSDSPILGAKVESPKQWDEYCKRHKNDIQCH